MTLSPRAGYAILALSVLCNGACYHLNKAALTTAPLWRLGGGQGGEGMPAGTLVICSNLAGMFTLLLCGRVWRRLGWRAGEMHLLTPGGILGCIRRSVGWVLLATAAGAVGSLLNTQSVKSYGPEMTAFLANLTLVFLVVGGMFSGERLTKGEVAVIAVIIAGAFVFSYRGGRLMGGLVGLMALSCAGTALKQFTVKRLTAVGDLFSMMAATLPMMALWNIGIGLLTGGLAIPSLKGLLLAGMAGAVGSVVGMSFLYIGYHVVGVARGAPIDALRPMMVLLIGVLILGTPMPDWGPLIGGGMILSGSAALTVLVARAKAAKATAASTRAA